VPLGADFFRTTVNNRLIFLAAGRLKPFRRAVFSTACVVLRIVAGEDDVILDAAHSE